jgi:ABC-type Zn2+ transport system substrate-binding protein/surface adhesin
MLVSELIAALQKQPADSEVELAVIAPVSDDVEDITVDRYALDTLLPWTEDEGEDAGTTIIWLVGGDDDDVDAFLDAIESEDDHDHDHDDHDHDHSHEDHKH